jgi:GT2 family glycosyltransferase
MIPVAGFLHYKNPDITKKCLDSFPRQLAESVVIIDNSEHGTCPDYDARIIRFYGNLGVAHGWNTIIKATPWAQWWAMFNSDLTFSEQDIMRLIAAMRDGDLVMMGGYHAFGVHRRCIKQAGWFDENYHPAYCEDNDFTWRVIKAGLTTRQIPTVTDHVGSATIKLDHALRERNNLTYPKNVEYHLAKWGGSMGHEQYEKPFNKAPGPAHAILDIDRLRDQHWESARE